ncbi:hypothetical protein IM793_04455 [Pedobacter sp. MR2016-19]|uniref:hypothetical protein n=1 Tax=Pedobacter sp. MR2016-19 TaxID=2780089 RepID=UPI0018760884|nr:hypothetical protein [Pedobacter sp. MR2016-19]MBE5318393.1 hypothetical protein [Pedobacter sp. MR2016-19]
MKKILLAGLLLSITQICYAQIIDLSKQNLKLGIGFKDAYMDYPFIKKAFIFSIIASVNKLGKIDSIYFSKTEDVELKDAMDINRIKKSIISEKAFFSRYKNCVVNIPVMALNLNDQYISNQQTLLREWGGLFPNVNKFKNKRVVLCKPISFWFVTDVD